MSDNFGSPRAYKKLELDYTEYCNLCVEREEEPLDYNKWFELKKAIIRRLAEEI